MWRYQATPSDTNIGDLTRVSSLFTATAGGKTGKLVALAGQDGLSHALDWETKEHLYATPVITRSNADAPLTVKGAHACPGVLGGALRKGRLAIGIVKPMLAAVATTSAGLIFTGEMTGDFLTLTARTGKEPCWFNPASRWTAEWPLTRSMANSTSQRLRVARPAFEERRQVLRQ